MSSHRRCCCTTGEYTLWVNCSATSGGVVVQPFYLEGVYPLNSLLVDTTVSPNQCMKAFLHTSTRSPAYGTRSTTEGLIFNTRTPIGASGLTDFTITISGVSAAPCCWNVCLFTCRNITVTNVSDLNDTHIPTATNSTGAGACTKIYTAGATIDGESFQEGVGCSGTPDRSVSTQLDIRFSVANYYLDCQHVGTAGGKTVEIQGSLCNTPGSRQCYPIYGYVDGLMELGTAYSITWEDVGLGLEAFTSCPHSTPLYGGTATIDAA